MMAALITRVRRVAGARSARLATSMAVGAALLLGGCDQPALDALARKVVFDYSAHAFTADRKFNCDIGSSRVEWVERVTSAGDGKQFAVELISRNGHTSGQIHDPDERAAFERLERQLETGGGARALFQRDPAPDDFDRMVANYWITIVELGRESICAKGEPSLTYLIESIHADRPFYVLKVSTRKGHEGFPLECQEYVQEPSGPRLVSDMVVTSLQWGVVTPFVAPVSPIVSRTQHDSLAKARLSAASHGITLLLPKDSKLPPAFELSLIEEVEYRTTATRDQVEQQLTLFRFVYSDGVEHIDFIEHAPLDAIPQQFLRNSYCDVAFVSTFGTISIATLLHDGTQVTIETRIAADRFESLMQALVSL